MRPSSEYTNGGGGEFKIPCASVKHPKTKKRIGSVSDYTGEYHSSARYSGEKKYGKRSALTFPTTTANSPPHLTCLQQQQQQQWQPKPQSPAAWRRFYAHYAQPSVSPTKPKHTNRQKTNTDSRSTQEQETCTRVCGRINCMAKKRYTYSAD